MFWFRFRDFYPVKKVLHLGLKFKRLFEQDVLETTLIREKLKVLRLRFKKGEISEKEYKKLEKELL